LLVCKFDECLNVSVLAVDLEAVDEVDGKLALVVVVIVED
jgi:hypothetical protein